MVASKIEGVQLAGVQAAVPEQVSSLIDNSGPIHPDDIQKVIKSVGVRERRVLPEHQCASDMCIKAAETLLKNLEWEPKSIDVLIYVSQDADYALPVTAALMQKRLGLGTDTACFDVPLGCSGFVYGSYLAAQFLQTSTAKRAIVLCGDTSTRHLKDNDTGTFPIFGDAGSAAVYECNDDASPMYFNVGTNGEGAPHINVRAGGRRNTLVPPKEQHNLDKWQQLYDEARLHLNGSEVFTFTLRAVPKLIADTLAFAEFEKDDIDQFVFHQANTFMLNHLRKKIKVDPAKFIIDMEKYGNTSSASIPLALCSSLADILTKQHQKILMAGFGVGWSWGAMIADVGHLPLPEVVHIEEDFETLSL